MISVGMEGVSQEGGMAFDGGQSAFDGGQSDWSKVWDEESNATNS